MNITNLKIVIIEPSFIIRSGVEAILKRIHNFKIQLIEISTTDQIVDALKKAQPDILIINPAIVGSIEAARLKEHIGIPIRYVALLYCLCDPLIQNLYDENISIYDSAEEIEHKLEKLVEQSEEKENTEEQQALSTREKEIVVCVVKGMTNREIADKLFLSTHTVITHRRNIARKLQIRSASGLTIYAIVNKLVELDEINHTSPES